MCIDIVEIWFRIANGQILSVFDRVICPPNNSGGVLLFIVFIFNLLIAICSLLQILVEHMEKFWVGHWRALFKPRQFTEQTITKLVKEFKKKTKKEVDPCHAEVSYTGLVKYAQLQI